MIKYNAIELSAEDFTEKVAQSELPVLVDWWAPWCGPCRMLAPVMNELATEFYGRAKVAKVNCDDFVDLARSHAVHSLPTVTLWKGGKEEARIIGLRSIADYRKIISGAF